MNIRLFTLILFFSVICSSNLWAVPVAPIESRLTQPDGTTFIAVARGDEFANWIETAGGHSIVKVNNAWYYAESDGSGGLRATGNLVGSLSTGQLQLMPLHLSPSPDSQAFEPTSVRKIPRSSTSPRGPDSQTLGLPHTQYVLTVLVDYTDISFTYTDASFQTLIYGAGSTVKDFFLDNSYTGFTIAAPVETYGTANDGIIHVTQPKVHPNQGDTNATSRVEAREIVALTDSFINYANYDANGDGAVTADELSIVIILAGYEASYGGLGVALEPNVWGHKFGFTSDLTLDLVTLNPYTMFGESHATGTSAQHLATIGIMCHELGHLMLGLPDLYDTDQSSEGIGDWGLMGGGSWNFTGTWIGDSPAHMNAWSKVATNFTIPEDIDVNQNGVSIAKADTSEVAKRIWIDKYKVWEYFLVENRQLSGYDAGLPGPGLLIWHIDDLKTTNSIESHKWVDLEEADGLAQLDSNTNQGDTGDPFPGSSSNTTFNDTSNPNSKNYAGAATQIGVTGISASSATMTANIAALAGGLSDHVRYDENGIGSAVGFEFSDTAWVGIRALNDTTNTNFDGVDIYVWEGTSATIDILYYSSMAGGTPSGLIHSQTGFAAGGGWNRLLLDTPQSFPVGEERGVVLKIVNSSEITITYDPTGVDSGRSYIDANGTGTFLAWSWDLNLVALLGGSDTAAPTATTITPSTTGPTNADSVSFDITFSEDVVNFNNSSDVTITHSGTSHSGVTITGSGASYNANVTGITGNGSFTLKVDTGSDVEDTAGNPLSSSVTSASVSIDNVAPTLSIGAPSVNLTNTGPVTYTITYSGADAVSLANGNVTLNTTDTANGSVAVSGSGTATRTVTISGITGNGTLGISIASGTASDNAGNSASAAGPSGTFSVDNTAPTAGSIVPVTTGPTNVDSVSFAVNFSESVLNFSSASDVTVTHSGTAHTGVTITGSGSAYNANVTGITGDGSFTLKVNTGSDVQDAAGNALASSVTSASVNIDNTAPTVSISPPSVDSTTAGPVTYTITYSGADSVTLSNGDVTLNATDTATGDVAVSGSGASSRTVTISNITGTGTLGISIAADTATDDVGNSAGAAGPSATVSVNMEDFIFGDSFEEFP